MKKISLVVLAVAVPFFSYAAQNNSTAIANLSHDAVTTRIEDFSSSRMLPGELYQLQRDLVQGNQIELNNLVELDNGLFRHVRDTSDNTWHTPGMGEEMISFLGNIHVIDSKDGKKISNTFGQMTYNSLNEDYKKGFMYYLPTLPMISVICGGSALLGGCLAELKKSEHCMKYAGCCGAAFGALYTLKNAYSKYSDLNDRAGLLHHMYGAGTNFGLGTSEPSKINTQVGELDLLFFPKSVDKFDSKKAEKFDYCPVYEFGLNIDPSQFAGKGKNKEKEDNNNIEKNVLATGSFDLRYSVFYKVDQTLNSGSISAQPTLVRVKDRQVLNNVRLGNQEEDGEEGKQEGCTEEVFRNLEEGDIYSYEALELDKVTYEPLGNRRILVMGPSSQNPSKMIYVVEVNKKGQAHSKQRGVGYSHSDVVVSKGGSSFSSSSI